jgi:5-methyltetrahydrofolate--homocysteine methyltransferase
MTKRSGELLARLAAGEVLLADGATGTMLQSQGLRAGIPETWVFEHPDRIRALHQSYIEAGSEILLTCTFGGTRFRLAGEGLGSQAVEVNRRAAELARQIAGEGRFVAGDMGPTGKLLAPLGPATAGEVTEAYAEQAQGLAEGGVDLILIETMSDLGEARAAIEGVRRVADLPLFCTFSFDTHGRTMMGLRPAQAARELGPLVQGIGANCGRDPAEYAAFLTAMGQAAPGLPLWAKPNAGLPRLADDAVIYEATPAYMGQIAVELRAAGAQVLGGCCGTTPAHIAAMAAALAQT